jgi:hypothetical protein
VSVITTLNQEPIERYSGTLSFCEPNYDEWLDFVRFGRRNAGQLAIVNLRIEFDVDRCNTQYLVRDEKSEVGEDRVLYHFTHLFPEHPDIQGKVSGEAMIRLVPDNGTTISVVKSQLSLNASTEMIFNMEGLEDRVRGPVQIRFEPVDAHYSFVFSTPIVSDENRKAIACAARDWGLLRRAAFCPFL